MKEIFFESLAILRLTVYSVFPYIVMCACAYTVGAFVEWSWNPQNWTWNARFLTMLGGVCYGFAFKMRMDAEKEYRNDKRI